MEMEGNSVAIPNPEEVRLIQQVRTLMTERLPKFSRLDENYILSFLRYRKYDLEATLQALAGNVRTWETYPLLFNAWEVCYRHIDTHFFTCFGNRDPKGRQVLLYRISNWSSKISLLEMFVHHVPLMDVILTRQLSQQQGVVAIVDLGGLSTAHVRYSGLGDLKGVFDVVQGFPVIVKAIHFLNCPLIFLTLWRVAKLFLKEKLRKRVILHSNSDLRDHLPANILPKMYGGILEEDELQEPGFLDCLSKREEKFNELLEMMRLGCQK